MNANVPKILIFSGILLLVASTNTFGWVGPCKELKPCGGGYDGTVNTCTGREGCEDLNCPDYCPQGAIHKYCEEVEGECVGELVRCNYFVKRDCIQYAGGCVCNSVGYTGLQCRRTNCY